MDQTQEEVLRSLLIRLEDVQREVGEVQRELILLMGADTSLVETITGVTEPPVPEVEELDEVPDSVSPAEELARTSPCINLVEWLRTRNIEVLRIGTSHDLDETFDRLAIFLGERFQSIRPFYQAIKRRVCGSTHPRAIRLTDAPPKVISDICQFANDLYRNGFLTRFNYIRSERTVVFEPQSDGRVTNFFTGDWLERYVLLTILERIETLIPEGRNVEKLTKAVVRLADNQETEFDILLGLPNCVLWLECKTGEWQEHAVKFGRISRQLGIPVSHSALVLVDELTPEQKRNASALANMTVINPEELEDFITMALRLE